MAALVIFSRLHMRDAAELEAYTHLARATLQSTKATVRVGYGRQRVLEGPATEGSIVIEFPSFEEAEAWYDSAAYQEAVKKRFVAADYQAIILETVG